MPDLVRLSISLDRALYDRLDRLVRGSGYTNRSEYVRDMIRQRLVAREWAEAKRDVLASITMVYDHHTRGLAERLIAIQHDHHVNILATTHVHLSHDLCAEMVMLHGRPQRLRRIADRLRQQRGVLHAELVMSSTGAPLR